MAMHYSTKFNLRRNFCQGDVVPIRARQRIASIFTTRAGFATAFISCTINAKRKLTYFSRLIYLQELKKSLLQFWARLPDIALRFFRKPYTKRDFPVSAVFWSPVNCTIGKTALIGVWFSIEITIWDFWLFKVPLFAHLCYWNLNRFFLWKRQV